MRWHERRSGRRPRTEGGATAAAEKSNAPYKNCTQGARPPEAVALGWGKREWAQESARVPKGGKAAKSGVVEAPAARKERVEQGRVAQADRGARSCPIHGALRGTSTRAPAGCPPRAAKPARAGKGVGGRQEKRQRAFLAARAGPREGSVNQPDGGTTTGTETERTASNQASKLPGARDTVVTRSGRPCQVAEVATLRVCHATKNN